MSYYNSAAPTSSSKNTINSIVVDYGIRDFLLRKNLSPVYPFLSTSINGSPKIGEPFLDTMVGVGNVVQPFGLPLETEGILRQEIALLPNQFKNKSSTAGSINNIENIPTTLGQYVDSTWPNGIQSYPTGSNEDVYKYGIMGKTIEGQFRKRASIKNLYLDVDKQVDAAAWITLEPSETSQQVKGYLDVYGSLNLGGSPAIQASSVIGSVLNGQELGLAKGGVVTNFDLRSSLAGRILGATGIINDTKLGMIGGQQLVLALANNAAFNVQQSLFGSINVQDNVLSLVKNGTLAGFRPNYQITVPSSGGGKVLDYTAKILGFTLPKSYLQDAGSIFLSESNSANIERANSMILNTGRGQVQALISNVNSNLIGTGQYDNPDTAPFRSGYAPGYKDNTGKQAINPSLYAFYNSDKATIYNFLVNTKGIIPEISYNRSGMIKEYGFTGPEENFDVINPYASSTIKTQGFTWGSDVGGTVNAENSPLGGSIVEQFLAADKKKSLLAKTQMLFNDVGMKNIVSGFGDISPSIKASQIQTGVVGGGISHGNPVMGSTRFDENGRYTGELTSPVNTYCRSWTTKSRYDFVNGLVRSAGINTTVPYRFQTNGSVLDQYGFPQIAPYSTDKPDDPKKYMFSIENLAWSDQIQNLLPCEVGPGDLMSGKQGRIMWFPPYNIKINESVNVGWEANQFIGRGESVYTYNNTERSGSLSFSVIVDHPSYINSFRGADGPDDHYVASFWAGCIDPSSKFGEKLTVSEMSSIISGEITKPQEKVVTPQTPPPDFSIYFPNDVDGIPSTYEDGKCGITPIDYNIYVSGCGIGTYPGTFTSGGKTSWNDNHNYGLNGQKNIIIVDGIKYSGLTDPNFIPAINTYLTEKCPACVVQVQGFASKQGNGAVNTKLADARSKSVIASLRPQLFIGMAEAEKDKRFKQLKGGEIIGGNCNATGDTDTISCKADRKAVVSFVFNKNLLPKEEKSAEPTLPKADQKINTKITNRFYTECNYFEQLTDTDSFVFDKFRDKIKYFHPAFHSTTPEGLNSRLTFLHQCTRQGRTLEDQGANNLAFGRPPVCILRVGDFYNTKIIIESINIDYDPIVWDINPEGIGVQPMIANVSLSFKFIGGSTLMGPINKLQNALSFNYYANTQVYDPRADYIAKTVDLANLLKGKDKGLTNTLSLDGNYALVNGIVNINSGIEKVETKTDILINTPLTNQSAAADNATGPNTPQVSTPSTTEPKITGIKHVEISNYIDNTYTVLVELKQEGIFTRTGDTMTQLISDADFKAFVNKGIKITLDTFPQSSPDSRAENIVPYDGPIQKNAKDSLFGLGYLMGNTTGDNSSTVKNLVAGNYMLTVTYNGNKIGTISVTVGSTTFNYYG